ncbi:MAG: glycine--tRNA ligase subunit beta [Helicobacter sp.]|nr:glycine--tRNA ligase subunit beta [Helicobacter sp.]
MSVALFIEIGTEELPAIPFLKELPNILDKFYAALSAQQISGQCRFDYTPRRLVVRGQIDARQQDGIEEFFGPPVSVAYQDGAPSKAFDGFLKRTGASKEEVRTTQKDGKEVLYYQKHTKGQETRAIIADIVRDFVQRLHFGKTMRWGTLSESFIRPVRTLCVMLDDALIDMELFGIKSAKQTFVHRALGFEPRGFETQAAYENLLEQNGVILDSEARKQRILRQIEMIEAKEGIRVGLDSELLSEIVAITEYPTALLGHFDAHFLTIPQEMIITSMKENQRYFPLFKGENLYNGFVVVSNAFKGDDSLIVKGNERVLRARLSDALFFYQNDLRNGFMPQALENVRFVEGLGSMADKVRRESAIALSLGALYMQKLQELTGKDASTIEGLLRQAAQFTKADLVSESVFEFTELQGIIGGSMAAHAGHDALVVGAIADQYLPKSQEDALPRNLFAAIFALAYRLDNLLALFSIGKIPSGSKDPFSLRRAANGIIRIVLAFGLEFDVHERLQQFAPHYAAFDTAKLTQFILERLGAFYDVNASLITAVLASGERDLCAIDRRLVALGEAKQDELGALGAIFKRVANITQGLSLDNLPEIRTEILNASEELELYHAFEALKARKYASLTEELHALLALREILDRYFDKVLVNAPDVALRDNRKALLARIYKEFLKIADFKEISIG